MKMHNKRSAFTLIELLVVMGIIMFLFGLGVAILPSVYQRYEAIKGAEMVQGALAKARQKARKSGKPTGIRFVASPSNGSYMVQLTYIEAPSDLLGGTLSAQPGNTVNIAGADLSSVQAGDSLEINYSGVAHRIAGPGAGALSLFSDGVTPALPYGVQPTTNYRIMRQPQPLIGEPAINLPQNVAIDISQCSTDGKTPGGLPGGTDIVFGAFGALTGKSIPSDKIILYIRDTKVSDIKKGYPTLIVIYTRTGFIAAHPVDATGANPYSLCNDPTSSGL